MKHESTDGAVASTLANGFFTHRVVFPAQQPLNAR